jgi:hypothetical protein
VQFVAWGVDDDREFAGYLLDSDMMNIKRLLVVHDAALTGMLRQGINNGSVNQALFDSPLGSHGIELIHSFRAVGFA